MAAETHLQTDPQLAGLSYLSTTIEELAQTSPAQYDAVVASEVIEHVDSPEVFLEKCAQVTRPGGSIFITTENRTFLSWVVMILGAEYLLGLLPRGTHQWEKFISPERITALLEGAGCQTRLVEGMR